MKTKYQADFPERAKKLAEEGVLDKDIAKALGINQDTLYVWQKRHPEFAEALKEGKRRPNQEVEAALFKAALGGEYQEREAHPDPNDPTGQRMKVTKVTQKMMPSNVTAQIFWLKNRMRDKWRDVREIKAEVQTGQPQLPVDMPDEEAEEVAENLRRMMPELFNGGRQHKN